MYKFLTEIKTNHKSLLCRSEGVTKFSLVFVNICDFLEAGLKGSKIYCFNESIENTGLRKAINNI